MENSFFPNADGRVKFAGRDQDLRTTTLIRDYPIRGEGRADFLGESEGSLPQPHDSLPDACEAINDFWSMSGNFMYRHHVEPRVKLHSPREESLPNPLRYIDVSRTTHTNLDVKQERRIDDYWNMGQEICLILGQVSLSLLCWKRNLQTYIYIYRVFRLIGGVFSSKNVCKLTFYQAGHFSFKLPSIRRVV